MPMRGRTGIWRGFDQRTLSSEHEHELDSDGTRSRPRCHGRYRRDAALGMENVGQQVRRYGIIAAGSSAPERGSASWPASSREWDIMVAPSKAEA